MKKKIFKIVKILFLCVLLVSIITSGVIYYKAKKSMAQIDGQLNLSILTDKVIVSRDSKGIPTIEANNNDDLYKAQGFIEAQDRLFQMDLARRQASGRLSEVVGKAALDNDKKFLTFQLRTAAEASYNMYTEESKKVLKDFKDGVNAYIEYAKKENKLPYEFSLLGYEPEEWTEYDSLVMGKYMAYDLGGHWDYQAFNNLILNKLGEEKMKELLPDSFKNTADDKEIIKANLNAAANIDDKTSNITRPLADNGSNNWVISGSRTESGKPIIADDPHLSLSTPSIWYQVHLKSPEVDVAGVIFGGLPGIMLGHNNDIAWTVTNVGPDVQDLYIEKQNPNNPHQYQYDGEWYNANVHTYDIKIKGQDSEKFDVVTTKHGPIINELMKTVEDNKNQYSMQWTALEPTNELEAVLSINKATDWNSFEKGLENFKAPAQNFLFADNNGNIAFKANGNIPIRKKGNGNLPVPGDSSEYGWKGYIPFNELPKIINPEQGYIATANTNTIGENYKYHISNVWTQPYRKARIDQVLSSKENITVEDMKNLQMDTKDLYAEEFVPKLLSVLDKNSISSEIYDSLSSWDYNADKDKSAPLIYDRWMTKIRENLMKDQITAAEYKFMPNKEYYVDELLRRAFRGDKLTFISDKGGLNKVVTESLKETITDLEGKYGKDISKWKWGEFHKLSFQNPLAKTSNILAYFFNPKEEQISGSKVTVKASRQNDEGLVTHGASWRFIYDFDSKTGYHITAPGASGHFMSEYYKNQVDDWINGTYNEEQLNKIEKNHTLELIPN